MLLKSLVYRLSDFLFIKKLGAYFFVLFFVNLLFFFMISSSNKGYS